MILSGKVSNLDMKMQTPQHDDDDNDDDNRKNNRNNRNTIADHDCRTPMIDIRSSILWKLESTIFSNSIIDAGGGGRDIRNANTTIDTPRHNECRIRLSLFGGRVERRSNSGSNNSKQQQQL